MFLKSQRDDIEVLFFNYFFDDSVLFWLNKMKRYRVFFVFEYLQFYQFFYVFWGFVIVVNENVYNIGEVVKNNFDVELVEECVMYYR